MRFRVPEDGKGLPPPNLINFSSVWLAGMGWASAILDNAIRHRPLLKSGLHRQVLVASVGWFLGYHLSKLTNYQAAKHDHEMYAYIKFHPENFPLKEKKTLAEIVEPFYPVR